MLNRPEIVRQVKQSQFVCSACGADRACDCNAPALERELARKEAHRVVAREHAKRKRGEKQRPIDINTPEPSRMTSEPDAGTILYGEILAPEPSAAEPVVSTEIDDPAIVKQNALDTIARHTAVINTYTKVFKFSTFDEGQRAELAEAMVEIINKWTTLARKLGAEVTIGTIIQQPRRRKQ